MNHGRSGTLVALGLLLAGTSAFGSFGAHYLGTASRDASEFRLYLDGGEFLGRTASFQSIRVTVHQFRQGRLSRTIGGCVYHFDAGNRAKDRIECAESAPGPFSGVVYVRDTVGRAPHGDEVDPMVCVQRCGARVPQRLSLEAENDNK